METKEIITKYKELDNELNKALITMERKSTIYEIRKQMLDLQKECHHIDSEFNWRITDNGCCPYCGKKLY